MVREIRSDDTQRLRAFHSRLSLQTIYLCFFAALPVLPLETAKRLTPVDYENRMVLVATTGAGDDEQMVVVVHSERSRPIAGEVALIIEDCWQGRGIASALL